MMFVPFVSVRACIIGRNPGLSRTDCACSSISNAPKAGAAEYDLLMAHDVNVTKQLRWYAGRRVTRRLVRAVPWIGGIIALATLRSAIRRKGFVGGSLHTALDMIPYVGSVKNLAEAGRGRDFIRDKRLAP